MSKLFWLRDYEKLYWMMDKIVRKLRRFCWLMKGKWVHWKRRKLIAKLEREYPGPTWTVDDIDE